MDKKSIFEPAEYAAMRQRLHNLSFDAPRQWGRMDVAQMLAHLNIPLETGLGKIILPREGNFITRPLLKWYVLSKTIFARNLPTPKYFVVADRRDFEHEKARLIANLDEAYDRSLSGPWAPHNTFGTLRPEQWGTLTWMHLDHHLRQFSA